MTPAMGQALIFGAPFALVIIGGLEHSRRDRRRAPSSELIESWIGGFFEDRLAGGGGFVLMIAVLCLRPEGLFEARSDTGRMKLLAVIAVAAFAEALPWLASSNYIISVALSACIFAVMLPRFNPWSMRLRPEAVVRSRLSGFWGLSAGYATTLAVMTFGGSLLGGSFFAALINAAVALAIRLSGVTRTNRHAFDHDRAWLLRYSSAWWRATGFSTSRADRSTSKALPPPNAVRQCVSPCAA